MIISDDCVLLSVALFYMALFQLNSKGFYWHESLKNSMAKASKYNLCLVQVVLQYGRLAHACAIHTVLTIRYDRDKHFHYR